MGHERRPDRAHPVGVARRYLVSLFTVGFLADRYGAKRVFLVSSIAASVSAIIFALFAGSFLSGALLYGLTGLFSGGSYTPGLTLIAERVAPTKRGRAMGFYLAAASFSYAVALMLTGALTPWIGWRGAFIVNASGPMVGTLLALYATSFIPPRRDSPRPIRCRWCSGTSRRCWRPGLTPFTPVKCSA